MWAALMFLFPLIGAVCYVHSSRLAIISQIRIRAQLTSLVYRKALALSSRSRQQTEVGKIVNHMSVDVNEVQNFAYPFGLQIISAPIMLIVSLILLYFQIKWATFIGLAIMAMSAPASGIFVGKIIALRRGMLKYTDNRVKLMNQLLAGIRVLKIYAWEAACESQILVARKDELKQLRRAIPYKVGMQTMLFAAPVLAAVASFAAYGAADPTAFTPARIFTAISLFSLMRMPLIFLPFALVQLGNALVSMRRLTGYLVMEERADAVEKLEHSGAQIKVLLASSYGTAGDADAAVNDATWWLRNVDLEVGAGELVCVVGRVGCGKTSLISALLGEMERHTGSVRVGGQLALVAQQAWIINASVRDNILLGRDLDDARWEACVEACCLSQDFKVLPAGADTEIGEKGINVSGGQKQRISLARACYHDADFYIMDDPLSAVDVHVGKHIFDECIAGLLKSKTRLLVTNQLQFVPQADRVVYLEAGCVAAQGSFEEVSQHPGFASLLTEFNAKAEAEESSRPSHHCSCLSDRRACPNLQGDLVCRQSSVLASPLSAVQVVMEKDGKVIIKTPDGRLIVQEDRAKGQVSSQVFREYAAAYGWYGLLFIICMWAMEQTCRVLTNWWLSRWSTADIKLPAGLPASSQRSMYLGVYVGLGLGYSLLVFMRSWSNALGGFHASGIIYRNSLSALIKAPMTFFDTTPIGRILNRFSKDTDDMDQAVPQSITELGNCLMQLLSTLIFISVIQPIFLAGMVPLMVVYYFLQMYYRRSYVELQRNDATTRSPVYAHFSETLTGVETVRAYGLQKKFTTKSDDQIDFNHRAYWSLKTADQWLSLRLDFIGACLVVLVALLAVANRNSLSASLAALSLSEILDVTGFLKYAVQSSAQFEARFNAVERILQYRKLEPESARKVSACLQAGDSAPGWPSAGALSYRGVWMQYRPELDPVLKGISFDVAAGEKIGIVGRTGSGKSSLIVTLFRLVEPLEGAITLDGQNILELGLEDVRSRIAAIPQDPVLFSGTVRSNLDPYDRHADHELWEALGHVALKEYISALSLGLQARVSEGGDNFSTGQRQLLCVARALLRKPKVLVADEATAAVDSETDALIQRTIRSSFKDSTVLTIAHRLNTILDSTKVLVMDDGHVAEFDTPAALIAKRGGIFRAMVLEAGLTDDLDEPLDLTSLARQLSSGSAAGTLPR
eukprot:jgi/Astpho2/6803/e_gw1.00103.48.1_t